VRAVFSATCRSLNSTCSVAAGGLIPFGFSDANAAGVAAELAKTGGEGLRQRRGKESEVRASYSMAGENTPPALILHSRPPGSAALRAPAVLDPTFVPGGSGWGFPGSFACHPHVAVWALLAIAAALVMHIQVATRLLSACPALYWYGAHLTGTRPVAGRLVWAWSVGYAAAGAVLHTSFYPWT
jgi:hypothetical protein